MGGRSGQRTGGGAGGAVAGSGASLTTDYQDVNIYNNGVNNTNRSSEYFLGLAGIPKDFNGEAEVVYYQNGLVDVNIRNEGITMQRQIKIADKSIYNALFRIEDKTKYSGKSLEIFTNQVKSAQKEGFKKITVNAAGYPNSPSYNGYYTWASYGYTPSNKNMLVQSIKLKTGSDYGTWENMMKSKLGRADWKDNGTGWDGTFDLKKGSVNIKQLAAYTKDKKAISKKQKQN